MKFVLLAEGQTEKEAIGKFLKRWLDDQLKPTRVGMRVVDLAGSGNVAKQVAKQARVYLSSSFRADTIGVIGLLDLYGSCIGTGSDGFGETGQRRQVPDVLRRSRIRGLAIEPAGDPAEVDPRRAAEEKNCESGTRKHETATLKIARPTFQPTSQPQIQKNCGWRTPL